MSSSTYPREETKRCNAEQEEPPPWGQTRKALRRARRTGGSQAAAARKKRRRPREFVPGGRSPSSTSPWQSRANWKIEMKWMKRETMKREEDNEERERENKEDHVAARWGRKE